MIVDIFRQQLSAGVVPIRSGESEKSREMGRKEKVDGRDRNDGSQKNQGKKRYASITEEKGLTAK